MQYLTSTHIKPLLPHRLASSKKGDNGRVLIIGGSKDYFGAPILAGIAALKSGADLVYLVVPECNFDVSRSFLPDLIVRKYEGEYLNQKALAVILELAEKCDAILIGPGLGNNKNVLETASEIIKKTDKPLILDADALAILNNLNTKNKQIIITPHLKEFENIIGRKVKNKEQEIKKLAKEKSITVLLKGAVDLICSEKGEIAYNKTGNAGMTVGGTGDVLSGVVASLIAQRLDLFSAGKVAAYVTGKAGDELYKEKGYGYLASEVAGKIPEIIFNF